MLNALHPLESTDYSTLMPDISFHPLLLSPTFATKGELSDVPSSFLRVVVVRGAALIRECIMSFTPAGS